MGKSGKLKAALDNLKGVDHKLERQKKLAKQAEKRKRKGTTEKNQEPVPEFDIEHIDDTDSSENEEEENGVPETNGVPLDVPMSEAEKDEAAVEADQNAEDGAKEDEDNEEDEEDEEDIPYSDIASLNSEERGDAVPFQRLTINNHAALATSLSRIALPLSTMPFSHHQSVTSAEPTSIPDIDDDLNRELAFYAQSLAAVKAARKQLRAEDTPFARPPDYFAEMVKSEEHMGRVRQRLVDDAAQKKASAEARKQRDLKKFGKAVQVAKLQERDKAKRETIEKIGVMKRKRSNALPSAEKEPDMFDIALESESKRPRKSSAAGKGDDKSNSNTRRQKKNEKYGFGGKKRHGKSGDAISSSDMRDFSVKRMKGKTGAKARPGKARRAKARA